MKDDLRTWRRRFWLSLRSHWLRRGLLWLGGIAVGLAAVGFEHYANECFTAFDTLRTRWPWWPFVVAPLGGAAVVYATTRWFDGAEGSGVPQVIAAMDPTVPRAAPKLLSLRVAIGKVLLGGAALFSGFSAGREGPTVHVGAALSYRIGILGGATHPGNARHLIAAGGAAGIAAAFNTPLAGVMFAIEELARSFEHRTNGATITAVILSGLVALAIEGNYTYFGRISIGEIDWVLFQPLLVCAVVCGFAGGFFGWLLLYPTRWMPARVIAFRVKRPALFAGACGLVLALLGLASQGTVFGSGYAEARGFLDGSGDLAWYFAPLKFLATLVSYISGIPAGVFAPSLAVGAGIGNALSPLFSSVPVGAIGALCMVGYLAAVTQSPITSFVIVMELTDNHSIVLSLMATALIASRVSSIPTRQLYDGLARNYIARFIEPSAPAPAAEPSRAGS